MSLSRALRQRAWPTAQCSSSARRHSASLAPAQTRETGHFLTERQWTKNMFEQLSCSEPCRLYLKYELNRLRNSAAFRRMVDDHAKIAATEKEVKRVLALFKDPEFEAGVNAESLAKKLSKKKQPMMLVREDLSEDNMVLDVTAKVQDLRSPFGMVGVWFQAAIKASEKGEGVKSLFAMSAIERQKRGKCSGSSSSSSSQVRDRPNERLKDLPALRRDAMRAKLELFLLASVDLANATAAEQRMPEFAPFAAKMIERQAYKYSHSIMSYNFKIKFLCDGIEQGKRYVVMRDGEELEIMWQKRVVEVLQTPEFEGEIQIPKKIGKGRK